ncbi:hypothetical protein BJ508DRAFT_330064 [Ascobolus immersus RN42]|uniref:Uncharacterized protein n=1 Tax=Ascobolus immersus RN42 TaxID=1160509 RepID=A0A3N4I0D3_ASCIM|nr:hypothetical protein BJ508DRAFT_330064 [Ascobolus immersus RN42]
MNFFINLFTSHQPRHHHPSSSENTSASAHVSASFQNIYPPSLSQYIDEPTSRSSRSRRKQPQQPEMNGSAQWSHPSGPRHRYFSEYEQAYRTKIQPKPHGRIKVVKQPPPPATYAPPPQVEPQWGTRYWSGHRTSEDEAYESARRREERYNRHRGAPSPTAYYKPAPNPPPPVQLVPSYERYAPGGRYGHQEQYQRDHSTWSRRYGGDPYRERNDGTMGPESAYYMGTGDYPQMRSVGGNRYGSAGMRVHAEVRAHSGEEVRVPRGLRRMANFVR